MRYRIPSDLRDRLKQKRLVFTVTTGRSGTGYLAYHLARLPGVTSKHEPVPAFSEALRQAQSDPDFAYEFLVHRKLPQIAVEPGSIYVETGHQFCEGFLIPTFRLGCRPDLIVLRRNPRSVALSFFRINSIPGRTSLGDKYLLRPDDPGVLTLPKWRDLHDYQLCYWYVLEIERRMGLYSQFASSLGAQVVETKQEKLITVKGFGQLIRDLSLPKMPLVSRLRYLWHYRQRINRKQRCHRTVPSSSALSQLEREVQSLVSEQIALGNDERLA